MSKLTMMQLFHQFNATVFTSERATARSCNEINKHAVDRLKFKYNIHYNENIIEHLQGLMRRFLTI